MGWKDTHVPTSEMSLGDIKAAVAWLLENPGGSEGGVTDHGLLTGLLDDDHPQYLTQAEADALYAALGHDHAGVYALVSHEHAGEDITSGTVADARIASTIARDSEVTAAVAAHAAAADPHTGYQKESEKSQANGYASLGADGKVPAAELPAAAGGGAPTDATYLVTTAHADLSAEVAVGTTPGGELGGTWASPTVDATHSGSSHAQVQSAAEATAAAALAAHTGDTSDAHDASAISFSPTGTIAATDVQAAIAEVASEAGGGGGAPIDAWPVGSIFLSVVSTSPATLLGGGTWEQIAQGRMLVGQSGGDADFDTAEETGGSKTVTLTAAQSGLPQHTHVQNPHSHTQKVGTAATGPLDGYTRDSSTNTPVNSGYVTDVATAVNQDAGPTNAAEAHNNMPPFLVAYIWKRTA